MSTRSLVPLILVSLLGEMASGQAELARFQTLTPQGYDRLGQAIAVSGEVMVAGAPGDNVVGANDAGAAYFYRRVGGVWSLQQRVVSSAPKQDGIHGSSVALDGVVAAIAGWDEVQLLRYNGAVWIHEQLLSVPGLPMTGVPLSVGLDGSVLVVGSPLEVSGAGALYVFREVGGVWTQVQKIVPAGLAPNDSFGTAVAVSGDTIVCGSYLHATPVASGAGMAFVYRWTGVSWQEEQQLYANDGAYFHLFGHHVDIDGDVIAVTAERADGPYPLAGAAYVFRRTGSVWTVEQKLSSNGWTFHGEFGKAVSIDGGVAVVGSQATIYGPASGAAFVFRHGPSGWIDDRVLTAGDVKASSLFGAAVSVDGDVIGVGGPNAFTDGISGTGRAYVFDRSTYPGCPGTAGRIPKLVANDEREIGGTDDPPIFVLNGLGNSSMFLAVSAGSASLPLGGGCILETQLPFLLLGPLTFDSNGGLVIHSSVPPTTPPVTVTIQAVVLDPGVPIGFSTTARVDVTLQ